MTYFIVREGAIDEAFETLDEANARAVQLADARVIGDDWVTLGEAKDRVERASQALDEVAPLMDPQRVSETREHLELLHEMIDDALGRLGLATE
jgi:hypothetical protein